MLKIFAKINIIYNPIAYNNINMTCSVFKIFIFINGFMLSRDSMTLYNLDSIGPKRQTGIDLNLTVSRLQSSVICR